MPRQPSRVGAAFPFPVMGRRKKQRHKKQGISMEPTEAEKLQIMQELDDEREIGFHTIPDQAAGLRAQIMQWNDGDLPHMFREHQWTRWFRSRDRYIEEMTKWLHALWENPEATHIPVATDFQTPKPIAYSPPSTSHQSGYWSQWQHKSWGKKLPLTPKIDAPSGTSGANHFVM